MCQLREYHVESWSRERLPPKRIEASKAESTNEPSVTVVRSRGESVAF
jgi:hypothetical protein